MKFDELGLRAPIVRAISDKGYETPSPIQAESIPVTLQGLDVFGCAQTGTGKTCAFALPILHRLSDPQNKPRGKKGGAGRPPRALVLCPTRELAMQIFDSFISYGKHVKQLRHTVVFGGVSQGRQVRSLRDGVDVLIATPGRLLDLCNQGHVDLSQIEVLVLDEADRMLDMGFIGDIRKVVSMVREDRQTLFFSATVSREIRTLADSILNEPVTIETAQESTTVEAIDQSIYFVSKDDKPDLLGEILLDPYIGRVLIFSKTKYGADKLVKRLRRMKIEAESIHGDKSQNARTRAMRRFKSGSTKVMIATDIASRGIDVDNITHVINYDMPLDPETYVHRIGRTARAGAQGIAISMCSPEEVGLYRQVERRSKLTIPVGEGYDELTMDPPPREEPRRKSGRVRGKKAFGKRQYEQSKRSPKNSARKSGPKKPRHRKRADSTNSEDFRTENSAKRDEQSRDDRPRFERAENAPKPKRKKRFSNHAASGPARESQNDRTNGRSASKNASATNPGFKKKSSKKKSNSPKREASRNSRGPAPKGALKPKKGNGYPKGRRVGTGVKSTSK